jgi:hypothetical protein
MSEKSTIYRKLLRIMEEIDAIPKRGYNDFHKYAYAMGSDVFDAVRKLFVKHGIALTASLKEIKREGEITTIINTYTLYDVETGDSVSIDTPGAGQDKGDKGVYKAETGGTKYFLMTNFLIPTGNDPEEEGGKKKQRTQAEVAGTQTRKSVTNDGPPNWSWFWTEAKRHLPEAEIRKRASEFFQCSANDLASVVKKQTDLKEFLDTKILPR